QQRGNGRHHRTRLALEVEEVGVGPPAGDEVEIAVAVEVRERGRGAVVRREAIDGAAGSDERGLVRGPCVLEISIVDTAPGHEIELAVAIEIPERGGRVEAGEADTQTTDGIRASRALHERRACRSTGVLEVQEGIVQSHHEIEVSVAIEIGD